MASVSDVTRDLTARRAVEAELRQVEERFHELVDAVTDYAIYRLDATGHVATWNAGARQTKGYEADEIIGRHFSVFYTPEDRQAGRPEAILDQVRRHGRFEEENWRVRKDGTRFWANVVVTALRDDQGKVVGFAKVTRDLTAKRDAAEQLRQAEQRFHHLVDAIADYAVFMLDTHGNVFTWNTGAEKIKGYEAREILGRHFSIFYTPEDRAANKPAQVLETVRRDGRFEEESWRVRKDGERFWAYVVITALYDENGTVIGFAKITRDLTARRQSEEKDRSLLREQTAREVAERSEAELRASEQRYRALGRRLEIVFEGVADGITVQDPSGRVVFANTAAARIGGFSSADELVNTPLSEVAARFELRDATGHPLGLEDLPARRVLAGEPPSGAVVHVRERATNRGQWILLRTTAVLGPDGKPELAINIWHDVTAERREELQAKYLAEATAALASSLVYDEMLKTLARVLVPGMADWCSIYLLDGERLRAVTVAHADAGKAAAAEHCRENYAPDPDHAGGVWGVLRTGASQVFNGVTEQTLARFTRDPEALQMLRSLGVTAALIVPIRARDRVLGAMALVHSHAKERYEASDVALVEELGRRAGVAVENAQLYKAAQHAARDAEEASRAKDEFLATISHELRTPLNAILGWSSLLKDRVTDAFTAKPIEVIHRNAAAQARIIEDILDVSRVITGKFDLDTKPADLVVILRHAIEVVRPSAEAKKIRIEFEPQAAFCLLVADPERLQQVAWNLLSNAVKFTGAGGSVRVIVSQEDSKLLFSVKDTGQGIDPAFLPFVFDRFRQADSSITRRVGGLGLGLAIVRHIVELHGGRVEAASEGLGKGATFTITLPVRAVASPKPAAPSARKQTATLPVPARGSLNGVRVLVVDDEPDARDLITAVLIGTGAEVETACSAAEGVEVFERFCPDVLVSDIGMPEEDGFAFIGRIRALPPNAGGRIPSLALTAFAREEDRTRALRAGYTAHVGKPVDPEVLRSAVANLAGVRHRDGSDP